MALVRCCLQRALVTFSPRIYQKNNYLTTDYNNLRKEEQLSTFPTRHYSYSHSPYVGDLKNRTEYEVFENPPEWKYVERLLPRKIVPVPLSKENYPSGWIPPKPESLNEPYYIARTKNHMLPIYLDLTHRGNRKITLIKKIQGDIWTLNSELKKFLVTKHDRIIATRVHELACHIEVKGDYILDTQDFFYSKGF